MYHTWVKRRSICSYEYFCQYVHPFCQNSLAPSQFESNSGINYHFFIIQNSCFRNQNFFRLVFICSKINVCISQRLPASSCERCKRLFRLIVKNAPGLDAWWRDTTTTKTRTLKDKVALFKG